MFNYHKYSASCQINLVFVINICYQYITDLLAEVVTVTYWLTEWRQQARLRPRGHSEGHWRAGRSVRPLPSNGSPSRNRSDTHSIHKQLYETCFETRTFVAEEGQEWQFSHPTPLLLGSRKMSENILFIGNFSQKIQNLELKTAVCENLTPKF